MTSIVSHAEALCENRVFLFDIHRPSLPISASMIRMGDRGLEIEIRAGVNERPYDLALVMERAYAGRDKLLLPSSPNASSTQEIVRNLQTPEAWSYAAAIGNRVVGFAIGFPYEGDAIEDGTEFLSLLMVDPDLQGRGIGNRLLYVLEERARQSQKQHIVLWTRQQNNSRTQQIYERRGYRRTGDTIVQPTHGPQYQYMLNL